MSTQRTTSGRKVALRVTTVGFIVAIFASFTTAAAHGKTWRNVRTGGRISAADVQEIRDEIDRIRATDVCGTEGPYPWVDDLTVDALRIKAGHIEEIIQALQAAPLSVPVSSFTGIRTPVSGDIILASDLTDLQELIDGVSCTAAPTCSDGIMNQDESDVDCGGSCPSCNTGAVCGSNGCESGENCQNCPADCGACCTQCCGGSAWNMQDGWPTPGECAAKLAEYCRAGLCGPLDDCYASGSCWVIAQDYTPAGRCKSDGRGGCYFDPNDSGPDQCSC